EVELADPVPVADIRRGRLQDRLDLVRLQSRALLQQQRHGTGDDRGGLRAAAALELRGTDTRGGVRGVDVRAGVAQRDDRLAGRDQIDVPTAGHAVEDRHAVVALAGGT